LKISKSSNTVNGDSGCAGIGSGQGNSTRSGVSSIVKLIKMSDSIISRVGGHYGAGIGSFRNID
jgi:hypothetical protein